MSGTTHYDVLAAVRRYEAGGPTIKIVLMILADYAGYHEPSDTWSCCPGQERIAAESEQSVRSVRNHLATLEAQGVIRSQQRYADGGGRKTTMYALDLTALGIPATVASMEGGHTGNIGDHTGTLLPLKSQREEPERTDTPLCPPRGATDRLGFPTAAAIRSGTPYPDAFLAFWDAYPRRLNKTGAYKAWLARLHDGVRGGVTVERRASKIVEAAQNYARSVVGKDLDFVKYAATFLGPAEPWKDYAISAVPEASARRAAYRPPAVGL